MPILGVERVVPRPTLEDVVPVTTGNDVVSGTAFDHVRFVSADQIIVEWGASDLPVHSVNRLPVRVPSSFCIERVCVTFRSCLPSRVMTQTSPARENAIFVPSGDQLGE